MRACETPISDETLVDYWIGDAATANDGAIEAHLFACGDCTARLANMASLGAGVAALARLGRISGLISRSLINRLQREGVALRQYSVAPGETVPCTVFPRDDLVVTALRGDFSAARVVTVSVTGLGTLSAQEFSDLPVSPSENEVFFAFPGAFVRQLPSTRVEITLTSAGGEAALIGLYVLDHTAMA
jgi:hypothetical protein